MKSEKITKVGQDAPKRRYDDACAATHAMDVLGERWSLPVMRELMLGPRRFNELKAGLNGISANVLTQRLDGLERAGVLTRYKLPPPASVQVYELTPWGYEAGPIFQAMGRWAVKSPGHDPTRPFSPVSMMLSFRTMIDMTRLRGLTALFAFRTGGDSFSLRIADGAVHLARGEVEDADLTVSGAPTDIAAAVYGSRPLEELIRDGLVVIDGDAALLKWFSACFNLPPKVTVKAGASGG